MEKTLKITAPTEIAKSLVKFYKKNSNLSDEDIQMMVYSFVQRHTICQ